MNPIFAGLLARRCRVLRAVVMTAIAAATGFAQNTSAPPPNVVLLLADDLGYADLSGFGSPRVKTPHLDRLAQEGMKFTSFYAASAVCSPSRAALLTGRFSLRAGVYSWIHPSHRMHLRVEETTIAELLRARGYATAHAGKWHLGYAVEGGAATGPTPSEHGFDHWFATGNNAQPSHHNPVNFFRNGKAVGKMEGYASQLVVDEALRWLEQRPKKNQPFFLNLWFHEPHVKVAAPERFRSRHLDSSNPDYYGCIENMDDAIGRLLARLDEMGVSRNTLIVFTSDNGSEVRGSNGPLRGLKTSLWEGGIRVPAVLRWPARIPAGKISAEPAGLVDLLPTLCAATGAALPADRTLDGVSLLPLAAGDSVLRRKPLYWFYNPSRPVCVIREGSWVLIADPDRELSRENMFRESFIPEIKATRLVNFRLFNIERDPGQTTDLAASEPARLNDLKARMTALHTDVMREAWDWHSAP